VISLFQILDSFRVAIARRMLCHWKSVDATFNYGLDGYMKTKPCIALFVFTFIYSVSAADSKIEQAVRDQDAQWSKSAESRDVEKLLSFYADDAVVLPAHAAIATTKDSIRNIFRKLLSVPGVALGWKATKVTVAGSGDLAYSTGAYEMTALDDSGKSSVDSGKYVAVWKKQADGNWKVAVDIWNTDLPLPAPSDKK
jgi:uncharacterized protein (TIGR02246 family)